MNEKNQKVKNATERVYESFKKYAVPATSVEDFCARYHKSFADNQFGIEQREACLKSYTSDLEKLGFAMIPNSSTISGKYEVWYGNDNPINNIPIGAKIRMTGKNWTGKEFEILGRKHYEDENEWLYKIRVEFPKLDGTGMNSAYNFIPTDWFEVIEDAEFIGTKIKGEESSC